MYYKFHLLLLKITICILCITGFTACSDDPLFLPSKYPIPAGIIPDIPEETVAIVSNEQDFNKIFGENVSRLKSIPFKDKSLLIVHGTCFSGISVPESSISKDARNMTIRIKKNNSTSVEHWAVGYTVRKGTKASDVQLSIEYVKAL